MAFASQPPGLRFGRYVLVERVATGGMAEVWRGVFSPAPGIQKTVAVKRVLPHLARDPDFLTLFRQEAGVSASLSHANVVQLVDMGEVDGEPYLALEFVHGRNLRQVLRRTHERGEPIPESIALTIAMEGAKGLAHAHARTDDAGRPLRIVHRDISPANMLVSFDGDVKVADFGIARASAYASTTAVGQVRGKAAYLSPEQIDGIPLDGRSDQFALAVVLWELLTGRKLFAGDSEAEILNKVRGADAPPPSSFSPVSIGTDEVVRRALSRDRDRRFADAGAFSRALAAVLASGTSVTTTSDVGTWLRGLYAEELAAERSAARARPDFSSATEDPTRAAAVPSPYTDGEEPEIQPLPLEERRKLFDLPPSREAAAPAAGAPRVVVEEALELDASVRRGGAGVVVERVRATRSGITTASLAGAVRLVATGAATAAVLGAAILLIYR